MDTSEKIKKIRIEKGLTTYDLSEKTGIPQSTISKIENGKRKIEVETLEKIAEALGISPGYFFNKENTSKDDLTVRNHNIDTIAAHLEGKNVTSKKLKLLEKYIDALFEDNE